MGQLGWTSEIAKVLALLSIGAGSMTVSHANDSYFWVVSQFSDMDTATAYKTQTGVTLVQGVTTITILMIIGFFLYYNDCRESGVGLMPSITIWGGSYGSDQMVLSAKDA